MTESLNYASGYGGADFTIKYVRVILRLIGKLDMTNET